jgi:hypothetical protein
VFVRAHNLIVVECEGTNHYAHGPNVTAFLQVAVLDGSRRITLYGRECHGCFCEVGKLSLGMREGRGLGGSFDLQVETFLDAIPLHLTPFFDGRLDSGQVGASFLRYYTDELVWQRCVLIANNGLRPAE